MSDYRNQINEIDVRKGELKPAPVGDCYVVTIETGLILHYRGLLTTYYTARSKDSRKYVKDFFPYMWLIRTTLFKGQMAVRIFCSFIVSQTKIKSLI